MGKKLLGVLIIMKVTRKFFIDYEKEENYLNKMSSIGLEFVRFSFFNYYFMDSTPGEYIYRIELLDNLPSHPESKKYIEFLNDAGVEYVCSWFRWVYLKKKASDGPFDIFSDYDSRIKHYKSIMLMFGIISLPVFLIGLTNLSMFINDLYSFNLCVGILDIIVSFLPLSIVLKYYRKIKKLKKEKTIRE